MTGFSPLHPSMTDSWCMSICLGCVVLILNPEGSKMSNIKRCIWNVSLRWEKEINTRANASKENFTENTQIPTWNLDLRRQVIPIPKRSLLCTICCERRLSDVSMLENWFVNKVPAEHHTWWRIVMLVLKSNSKMVKKKQLWICVYCWSFVLSPQLHTNIWRTI